MTTREARKNLCKLIQEGKPVLIHKGGGWQPSIVAVLTPLPAGPFKGKTEAQRLRARDEAALAAVSKALKEAR